jgi:TIR domain
LSQSAINAPSTIGTDTLFRSKGQIPDVFLRGCGVPESLLQSLSLILNSMEPIQFYSCFISYSSKNQDFAERLHADLQAKGVRTWFDREDLKIGDKIRHGINEAIRVHDKLMLVLTKLSIASDWVEGEVEAALERERREKRTVLFPIRLDDAVMETPTGWASHIRQTRHIGDFRGWKEHDAYQKSFDRLLRDLKAVPATGADPAAATGSDTPH